jgi:hypothetical protein
MTVMYICPKCNGRIEVSARIPGQVIHEGCGGVMYLANTSGKVATTKLRVSTPPGSGLKLGRSKTTRKRITRKMGPQKGS